MHLIGYLRNTAKTQNKPGARREWFQYKAELVDEAGKATKIGFGFNNTPQGVTEGDYVELDVQDENGFLTVDLKSVKRLEPPKKAEQPAQVEAPAAANYSASSNFGEFNRQTNPIDAGRMTWNASRSQAIEVVKMLLEQDALKISAAKGGAGVAARFDEIMASIDKITVEYHNDALTLRKLQTVADAGVISTAAESELPQAGDASKAQGDNSVDA